MKDFELFLESGQAQLPPGSLETLKKELFPSALSVAVKIGLIHVCSSLLTLMVCPQFGFRLFFEGHGLMHYFMKVGSVACFALCGAFYLGSTLWISKIFLGEFEWELVRKHSGLSLGALSLVSIGIFSMISHTLNFEIGLVWLLGALVSGIVPLRTSVRHRPLLKI